MSTYIHKFNFLGHLRRSSSCISKEEMNWLLEISKDFIYSQKYSLYLFLTATSFLLEFRLLKRNSGGIPKLSKLKMFSNLSQDGDIPFRERKLWMEESAYFLFSLDAMTPWRHVILLLVSSFYHRLRSKDGNPLSLSVGDAWACR